MVTQTKETQSNISLLMPIKCYSRGIIDLHKMHNQIATIQNKLRQRALVNFRTRVLSCIDSRVPVEVIFDQGIGDIFSARVAGNIINEDMLGSMEYACKVAGSKLVLVLGHTKCGAVTAACKKVELGNITPMLAKIKPAVQMVMKEGDSVTEERIEEASKQNVRMSIEQIKKESEILSQMEKEGDINIIGGIYNVATGVVEFI